MRALALLLTSTLIAACSPSPEADQARKGEQVDMLSATEEDEDELEGTLVKAPEEGSPEALLQGVVAAAMYPDENAGWEALKALLHSELKSPKKLESYREMNYAASRRKVKLFTPDDTKPYFRVVSRSASSDDEIKLFVHNEQSLPTPCTLKRDSEAANAWRVYACSL